MKETDYRIEKKGNVEKWYDKKTDDLRKEIEYWPDGSKQREEYFLNGKYHRENGPARQGWYENGTKRYEAYYINGTYHREDGPTRQSWNNIGTKETEEYWLNDKIYSKEDWLKKVKIKTEEADDKTLEKIAKKNDTKVSMDDNGNKYVFDTTSKVPVYYTVKESKIFESFLDNMKK
jgi:hypothetical protein